MISFRVYGKCEPGGSKKAFNRKGGGRPIVTDANSKAAGWKHEVKNAYMVDYASEPLMQGPLVATVCFYRQRPKAHYDSKGNLRDKFKDTYPTSKPDTTKLMRPLEDALTGLAYPDDAQIVDQHLSKRFGERPGAHVILETMEEYLANEH